MFDSGKTRQFLINFAIFFITICIIVGASEFLVRTFFVEPVEQNWAGAEKKYYEYDSLLGWKKIPNLNTKRDTAGSPPVAYKINSRSIRGPEYSFDKTEDEYRILILGDSFAEGFMVEYHELFSEVMKTILNKKWNDKYYEVINSGTSGWSTDQELLFFQKEGKKYNPDLTILMFYENDIAYNNSPKDWGMYYKPLFAIKDGELVLRNVPVPKPDIFRIHDYLEPKKSIINRARAWLDVNSYLYKLAKERIKNTYKLRKLFEKTNIMEKSTKEEDIISPEYRVWEKNYNDTVRESWKITEKMIIKLREESASVGSELLVFYVPFEGSIYSEVWDKLKRVYNLSDENWTSEQAGIVLEDICKRNNIDFLNPTEQLKIRAGELEKDKKRLYSHADHHWTVAGNKFVGEILAEYVALKYLDKK